MNRVLAHTGARYPILQAPMGWIARSPLAMAVSRAGGLGIIETSSGETENCQHEIAAMLASGLPFGVNLPIRFLKDDAMLRYVCESGIRFVTTSAGSPAKFVAPLKAAGIAGTAWLEAMQAEEAIVANRKGRRTRARMRQGQGRAQTGQGSHTMPYSACRREAVPRCPRR